MLCCAVFENMSEKESSSGTASVDESNCFWLRNKGKSGQDSDLASSPDSTASPRLAPAQDTQDFSPSSNSEPQTPVMHTKSRPKFVLLAHLVESPQSASSDDWHNPFAALEKFLCGEGTGADKSDKSEKSVAAAREENSPDKQQDSWQEGPKNSPLDRRGGEDQASESDRSAEGKQGESSSAREHTMSS